MLEVAVRCRGVTKSYGSGATRVAALRGVDLDVSLGELLMLVGPSGSGKTTLVSIVSGLALPDEGECRVLGEDLRALDEERRARFRSKDVGFVFQAFRLLPALSAAENVGVPLVIQGVREDEAEARAVEALALVGLRDRAGALPAQLSGGQQQRVAIARALVHEPRLLVCDEPTSALDHATGQAIVETLQAVARSPGRAVIVVTHDPRIQAYADRVASMEDGRVTGVAPGKASEAVAR